MICSNCQHEDKMHCKGGVKHTDHKEDARMVPSEWRRANVICKGRHCEHPLCACIAFKEKLCEDHA